jgi:hypothetical protein
MRKVSRLINTKSQKKKDTFNVQAFLDSAGVSRKVQEFRRNEIIFRQGDPSKNVMYKFPVLRSWVGDRLVLSVQTVDATPCNRMIR